MPFESSTIRSLFLDGPAGRLEALLNGGSADATHVALVCHPHPLFGGTMHNKVVFHAMKALNSFGFSVLRFNFRGTGLSEGQHANGVGEVEDVRAALDYLEREFPQPVMFAGFSFGAAVGSRAAHADPRVTELIALGLPAVEVDNRTYDFEFLRDCTKPKLFVSGSRDQYGPAGKLEALVETFADPKKLVRIEAGDHFFEGRLREMREAMEDWVRETVEATAPNKREPITPTMTQIPPVRLQQFARMRQTANDIFATALTNASIESAFDRNIHCERRVLRIGEDLHDLDSYSRIFVVSIGKAGHTMASALEAKMGSGLEGIVASSVGPAYQVRGFRYFRGGHPTPNAESVRAADAILKSLGALDSSELVIFMISGGGSSLVEKLVDDEISFDDLAATYRALVHSGAPIAEINAIRKHLSAVKGGRLAQAAYPAQQVSILVSDVPDDTPDALASGPTMPDSTSIHDCETIAAKYDLVDQFPTSVADLFRQHALDETPKSDDPAFVRSRWWTVLSNKVAIDEAAIAATRAGFAVEIDNSCDDWPYDKAATYLLDRVRGLRRSVSRVCLISGGEVTVALRNGGVGGRNQQFALACAEQISGEDITVLSAGTDGIDGNSPAAGAVVDGNSAERVGSLAILEALEAFNAYPLLESLGDVIVTGPTGNNLRDLRILLAY